ncbi:trypsin-7-like [Haematobia irritans]|uniref:trypsin-7-like n=1 Tax=Haematobia irritans TaxID=7368 RepID=UPI003F4FFEA8
MLQINWLLYLTLMAKYSLTVTQPLLSQTTETVIRRLQLPINTNTTAFITPRLATAAKVANDGNDGYSSSINDLPLDVNQDGRIVGGQVTSILNYPYIVSLQYQKSHICGGSILTSNIILTAAHCIDNPQDVNAFQVRVGSSYHNYGGQVLAVRQIIKHERYNLFDLDCDVALVVLRGNLTFSRLVMPVALPQPDEEIPDSQPLHISGWGLTSETGSVAPMLNHVAVNLMNHSICEQSYRYVATITKQMFCAGLTEGGKDSCQGDSGGPLVSYAGSKVTTPLLSLLQEGQSTATLGWSPSRPIQYGIVSFGVGCAQKGFPGVYTNVAAVRPWIDERIRAMTNVN